MTKEQAIELARKVWGQSAILPISQLEEYAKLVGNAKLEQAAKECMKQDGVHDAIYAEAIESLKEPTP